MVTPKQSIFLANLTTAIGMGAALFGLLMVVHGGGPTSWPARDLWLVSAGMLLGILALMHRQDIRSAEDASLKWRALSDLDDLTRERDIARLKTTFVSNVSHEFKTPLSSIKACVEMLGDGEADDKESREDLYHIISTETWRLERLVDNVLDISRIEAGVATVSPKTFDLAAIAREAVSIAQEIAQGRSIVVQTSLSGRTCKVRADDDMILRAILSLLSNAIKYTDRGGEVIVSVWPDEQRGTVICEVQDTGAGMSGDELTHVFEKFYRSDGARSSAEGAGLGLTLVKGIIETVHRGSLRVSSSPGQGSTFGFELRAARRSDSEVRQEECRVAKEDPSR